MCWALPVVVASLLAVTGCSVEVASNAQDTPEIAASMTPAASDVEATSNAQDTPEPGAPMTPAASSASIRSPEPVQLITGPPDHDGACFLAQGSGLLVVDPTDGTAIVDNNGPSMLPLSDVPVTVAWPPGFTARRSGAEIEVLDPQGNVVATTGRSYTFMGGFVSAGGSSGLNWPELKKTVLWACGPPLVP